MTQYIIMNLGMSENFGTVDLKDLVFPVSMHVDYVRVYQVRRNHHNLHHLYLIFLS